MLKFHVPAGVASGGERFGFGQSQLAPEPGEQSVAEGGPTRLVEPYSGEPLETMTADLRAAYAQAAVNNGGIAGIVPVGDAFLQAVQEGFAVRDPYLGDPSLIDLWWAEDHFHPSTHGSYLSALMMFGAITGIDPASFGAAEKAASDLGISPLNALQLQGVASRALAASGQGLTSKPCLHAHPISQGAAACTRE